MLRKISVIIDQNVLDILREQKIYGNKNSEMLRKAVEFYLYEKGLLKTK